MKYTIRENCLGEIDLYETPDNIKYQTYLPDWYWYTPKYYNFIVKKGYTNLPSPVILKFLKTKVGRELLNKVLREFIA